MITKRVYELELGDIFVYCNVRFIVFKKTAEKIYYKNKKHRNWIESFGAKNQMKVEIIPSGSEESNMMLLHQPEDE